jgi:flagellar M-ring protein FliF
MVRYHVDSFLEGFKKLGAQRMAAMAMVALILAGFFGYITLRVSQPGMSTLFTDLSNNDAVAISKDLDAKGIKYEMTQDGSSVRVPKDQVLKLRMDLASKGMPTGGGIGYEIFDKGDNFSATSFVQNINNLRALEGELVRTIRSIDRIQNARVHLVIPERKLFSREKQEPRASIVVKVRGELDAGQIRAIRHLTASAVEGLKPDRVSIVDEAGRLLADGAGNETDAAVVSSEKQSAYEKRLRNQVEEVVASVVGRGRTRVQVAADIDFNRVQQTSETFDPETRVVRSTQTRNKAQVTTEAKDGTVSVGNELPAAQQNNNANSNTKDNSQENDETVNYEISKTVRTETIEGGRIKKLSVAVLVDGSYTKAANGDMIYSERPEEDRKRIETLVRTAVGIDKARGDQVEVVSMRFAEAPAVDASTKELSLLEKLFSFSKDDTLRLAELGMFAILTLIVLFLVVRPLLKQIVAPEILRRALPGFMRGDDLDAAQAQIAAPENNEMVEFSQMNGGIKASTVDQVGKIVQNNPQETIGVLRNWIHGAT